jgi:hypothetical protein
MDAVCERELKKARERLHALRGLAKDLTGEQLKELRKQRRSEVNSWMFVIRSDKRKRAGR